MPVVHFTSHTANGEWVASALTTTLGANISKPTKAKLSVKATPRVSFAFRNRPKEEAAMVTFRYLLWLGGDCGWAGLKPACWSNGDNAT